MLRNQILLKQLDSSPISTENMAKTTEQQNRIQKRDWES